jgi:hypothetical protein
MEYMDYPKEYLDLKERWTEKKNQGQDLKFVDTGDKWLDQIKFYIETLKDDNLSDNKRLIFSIKLNDEYERFKQLALEHDLEFDMFIAFDQEEALRILITKYDEFSDCEYWNNLSNIYTLLVGNREKIPLLKKAFQLEKGESDCLMTEQEKSFLGNLPDEVKIYRGMSYEESESGDYGLSWTLDKSRAEFFAFDHPDAAFAPEEKTVVEKTVSKDEIIAYFSGRDEEEVIWISNSK